MYKKKTKKTKKNKEKTKKKKKKKKNVDKYYLFVKDVVLIWFII